MPLHQQAAVDAQLPPFLPALFVPQGSQYYLAVATPTGALVEGTHFHLLHFAERGFLFSSQQIRFKDHWIVLYDWRGQVLDYYYPASPWELDLSSGEE